MKDYLELSQAADLKDTKDRITYRFFEILPGLLSFTTLGLAFFFSWWQPIWAAVFIIIFDIYWVIKIIYLLIHQIYCYRQMKVFLEADWHQELERFPEWSNIYHLIILPVAKEGWEIVADTLESLKKLDYPKDKMIVVLAQEEAFKEKALKIKEMAEEKYGDAFYRFLNVFHPAGLSGEVRGKGSNVAFAGEKAKELIKSLDIPWENILVSPFDIDTKVYSQYFLRLTYCYLENEKDQRLSFQPVPVYLNNVWQSNALARVIAANNSFWQMMQQERPEQLATYSSHSMTATVFFEVGYPKNIVSDDSRIFWKSLLRYDGDYKIIPLYYPLSMDVVMGETFFQTVVNQYKQQKRWAWGCVEIPYVLYGFLKNKKISLGKKFFYSWVLLDGFWSWACASLLIFFLGWLPLFLGGDSFNVTLLSYNLPRLTGAILTVSMVGMVGSAIINFILLPSRPKTMTKMKNISLIFQWLLLPLALIAFGALPALDSQARLMFGKYLEFWNTPKPR
jgi:cellulose synthase/poly-beta-1,6-N-acetylglucosamine synthase-like glycosyltransferase